MPAGQPFTGLCQQLARPPFFGRADLHLHTTASDGAYSPGEVVDLARRCGLAALAITDHDTLLGIGPARAAAAGRLEIIAGVEITAEFRERELHLLGFFFDQEDEALKHALDALRRHRVERFHEMVQRLRDMGVTLAEENIPDVRGTTLGRRHLAEMLVKARRVDTVSEAFQRYLGDRGRAVVPKRRLPVGQAIALVRGAGGVAAWAHPTYDCTRGSLAELRDQGMQALEVDFPSCRGSRARELRGWARKLGLAVTGGSDCHGPGQPQRAVGARGVTPEELETLRAKIS